MGAASYFEDIEKRRDEALSQFSEAGQNSRIAGTNLENIVHVIKRLVDQEYAKILTMMDIITSPEINLANENLNLKAANASLEETRNIISREVDTLNRKLLAAEQRIDVLLTRTRRLDRELHELKQRKRFAA